MSDASKPAPGAPGHAGAASSEAARPLHFIEQIVEADNASGKWGVWRAEDAKGAASAQKPGAPRVHTRFPPEPNGYLHIGHAKSICLNHGLAAKYGGKFNLRFDDTNPAKEEQEYVDAIIDDVRWLGADFDPATGANGGGLYWASDYFQFMYDCAVDLIRKRLAYVCELSADEVSKRRGAPGVPATSPFRDRPAEESLRLFDEMRDGKHANGAMTLRAKIDLASPNFNLRDPVMYRILHETHHNTGDKWCIYPMYDWAHGLEDSLEGVTHSICTLEFENHRPLYDWFIDAINQGRPPEARIHHPQQIEFAKFLLNYTVLSKRNLLKMVEQGVVSGWDDPRMPTIRGYRRRGYTPQAVRAIMDEVGVTKTDSVIDIGRMENAIRDDLNRRAPRRMAVIRPLRVVIENWPEEQVDHLDAQNNPEDPGAGSRKVPFSRVIYIERDDFMEDPPKKFFRLSPGREVRLRWAYFITCTGVVKDPATGEISELRCTYDPASRGGDSPDGRKVKATLHWVSARHAAEVEVRLFDRLFKVESPGKATGNFLDDLNPASLEVARAYVEPALAGASVGDTFQFERLGYFCMDRDSRPGAPVFNRTVTLKDTWAKAGGE
ncbi:MAG: glutamine--tRNA ligase/YqeY domain fusion protein [Planctomycetota bacterium]|nr:glutamine--tRNA ligase/YqeY domain fusion protein [Planctomycetota bacterium]